PSRVHRAPDCLPPRRSSDLGFQDINYGRSLLEWGLLPTAAEITAEGLFSEYDLPTPEAGKTTRLLEITGDAKAAAILNRPEVTRSEEHTSELQSRENLVCRL